MWTGFENPASQTGVDIRISGLRQTLRKIPQTACWGAPLAHWQTIVALFWKTYDLLQILLNCCLTVVY